jgi:DNA modification methylase
MKTGSVQIRFADDRAQTDDMVSAQTELAVIPARLTQLKVAIESATDVRDVKDIRDKAEALRGYAKQAGYGLQIQNSVCEVKIMAERRAGKLLARMVRPGNPQLYDDVTIRLQELGITRNKSSQWQLMATVPKHMFQAWVKETKENGHELTSSGLLRLADSLRISTSHVRYEVPTLRRVPITKRGDVWQLGEHRVFCGNAIDLLPKQGPVDLILTDPPYGQGGEYGRSQLGHREVAGDDNLDWLPRVSEGCYRLLPDNSVCLVFGQWRTSSKFVEQFEAAGFRIRTVAIWDKENCGLSSHGFGEQYEQILVFYKGQPTLEWFRGNVFREPRINGRPEHPNEKPLQLFTTLLGLFPSKTILDPFLGSGPTLIAAERLGRVCFGFEIDEAYCDVAVKRWQNFTGREAILKSTGQTFSEVADLRMKEESKGNAPAFMVIGT